MRIGVDAHAIGRRLTGNEVYVRSLLNGFAALDRDCEIVAYVSAPDACAFIQASIRTRRVAANPLMRLGDDLAGSESRLQPSLPYPASLCTILSRRPSCRSETRGRRARRGSRWPAASVSLRSPRIQPWSTSPD